MKLCGIYKIHNKSDNEIYLSQGDKYISNARDLTF